MHQGRAHSFESVRHSVDKAHFESSPQTGALDNAFTLEDGMFSFNTPVQFPESSNQGGTSIHSKSYSFPEDDGCQFQEDFAVERLMIWQDVGKSTRHIYAQTSPDVGQQALPDFPFSSLPAFYAPIYRFLNRQPCPSFHLAIPPPSQTTGPSSDISNMSSSITVSLKSSKHLWLYLNAYRSNMSLGSFRTKMVKEFSRNRYRYSASLPETLLESLYRDMANDPAVESDTLILMRFIPEASSPGSWADVLFTAVADFIRAPGAMMDEIKVHRIPNKALRFSSGISEMTAYVSPPLRARVGRDYPILSLSIPSEKDPVPILFCAGPQSTIHLTSSGSMDVPESAIRSPSDSIP